MIKYRIREIYKIDIHSLHSTREIKKKLYNKIIFLLKNC